MISTWDGWGVPMDIFVWKILEQFESSRDVTGFGITFLSAPGRARISAEQFLVHESNPKNHLQIRSDLQFSFSATDGK